MNLSQILEWQFPGKDDAGGYTLTLSGTGEQSIGTWDEAIMGRGVPTQAELAVWALPAAKYHKRRELRRDHDAEYRAMNEMDGQFMESERDWLLIREFRVGYANLTVAEKAKVDQRQALRNKLMGNATATGLLDQVNAATTVAQVDDISWNSVQPAKR